MIVGPCQICGENRQLTFEHLPPRAAFNDRPTINVAIHDALRLGPNSTPRGPIEQRGAGAYSLCESCNSKTGHWYGSHFVDWCYQAAILLNKSKGMASLHYLYYIFPLSVLKQIVSMFLSLNKGLANDTREELARFVLNPEMKHLAPTYRFFTYYTVSRSLRYVGVACKANMQTGAVIVLSEMTFPPFGYVMTLDSRPPDNRLVELTHFAHFAFREFKVLPLAFPVLPVASAYPGDYRSEKDIWKEAPNNSGDTHS